MTQIRTIKVSKPSPTEQEKITHIASLFIERIKMGAPREACNIQLVKIQHGERLVTTPEPTFAPDRATCLREAKGRGYRATTQVKEWSPEITYCVGGRYCSFSIRQNPYNRKWQGCESPTGSETVALYQKDIAGTWENRYIPDRICDNKPINGKDAQTIYRWSDKPIVARKFRNGNGAKGLTGRPLERNATARLRTGEQLPIKPNPETSSMMGDAFPKSRVRENRKHGSVRGFIASPDENNFIRRWL